MSILLLLAAANGAAVTPAQPTSAQPEIVVTGSRVATAPEDLAANITVLGRDHFDVEKPANLADLLRRVAGIHIDQVGGRGGTGSLYLRGADPNYTLVLVDGVRVNDPTNSRGGSFDLSALDIADIERVEIARGPYSAIYGGDALAGVINIITRPVAASTSSMYIEASAGAYDTNQLAVNAAVATDHGRWRFGFSDINEGERVRGNDFDAQRLSGGFDTSLGNSTALSVSARYSESMRRGFPDDSGGYANSVLRA